MSKNKMTASTKYGPLAMALLLIVVLEGCAGSGSMRPPATTDRVPEILDEMAFYHFSNGTILMLDKNYTPAVIELEKALTFEPDSREIRLSLGECYQQLREYDKAIAVVSAVTPKDSRTWNVLATYYRYMSREDEAYDAYREVLHLDSSNTDAYWYLVQLEMRRGRPDTAVVLMEQLARVRRTPRMLVELGRMYHRAERLEQAVETLQDVVDGVYGSPPGDGFELLGDIYMQLGQYQQAVTVLRRGTEFYPQQIGLHNKLVDALINDVRYDEAAEELATVLKLRPRPEDRLRLAEIYFQLERLAESDSLYAAATQSDPDIYLPQLRLGQLKLLRGQYDSARVHLARAVEIDDEKPDAYLAWANSYLAQDSVARAIAIAREGEFIARPRGRLQFFIGVVYSRREVYDSAIVWLEMAESEEPADLNVRFSLGAAYERAGRYNDADTTFQRLIAVDSSHAGALNYLGYMYADRGEHLEISLRLIERAVQIEPENSAYLDSYAWVLFKLERVGEADVQIRKAFEHVNVEDPVMYDHFGDILARQGLLEQAREQWAKALKLDPDNETIKEKLLSNVP
jgi:tetratricopeptide (TPR) repeat protein